MKTLSTLVMLAAVTVIVAGCAGTESRLRMDYGTSHKLAKFNQTLNPDAEKNLDPAYGMDSQAAQKAVERYRKDFEKPPQAPTYTLSIGSIGRQ